MQISFLLGPAGAGKTFRCLSEIRTELSAHPEGNPLIFLAPKQATFQIERQLLASGEIKGYSRLQILSFERLARFIFDQLGVPLPRFISEQGRTMVLRALLGRLQDRLLIFRGASRRQGFAEQLARQIREFANHGLTPESLHQLAGQAPDRNALREKLHDFSLIFEAYRQWLAQRSLQDSDALLAAAAALLGGKSAAPFQISGLWVDGFAQLTPEERRLLVSLLPCSRRTRLAFCVDPVISPRSAISPWYLVNHTVSKCRVEIETKYGCAVEVEHLSRNDQASRFSGSPALRELEIKWTQPEAPSPVPAENAIRLFECADPEAEAVCCAREILRFVRDGGRFREAAVLARGFQNDYPHVLRRVFRRYQIPHFIDHRENVAHHPLAELTRGTLRTIAYGWEQRDWFSVLKTGLIRLASDKLDLLENEALARGWKGPVWREGFRIADDPILERELNETRERIMPPFITLAAALKDRPNGRTLAEALRTFWRALSIEEQLENWARESPEEVLHSTVWEQMNSWLDDVELAFGEQPLFLSHWIPILDSGLASLTVGVIPPVLDEVLVGAVDRSRNPDLKMLCVVGLNEKVFPAIPAQETLLTEDDRDLLQTLGSDLAHIPALKLASEQFYGYIACTRARERLCLSYSRAGLDGTALNPSRFVAQLGRIFPKVQPVHWNYPAKSEDLLHSWELAWLGIQSSEFGLSTPNPVETLSPEIARQLYSTNLTLSVSRLERFASCPFRFFAERGLNLRERDEFKLDAREKGNFQHQVLFEFHQRVTSQKKRWRDLSVPEGRELIRVICEEQLAVFHDGLLLANSEHRFTAESYQAALQELIQAIIEWFTTNDFDPEQVELAFGPRSELQIPGWTLNLADNCRMTIEGRIDRVDLLRNGQDEALCLVIDYKSGQKKPDRTLVYHGVEQQLVAYLLALTKIPEIASKFGVKKIRPAGGFLLPLRASFEPIKTRTQAASDEDNARRGAYAHNGVFDLQHLSVLDQKAPQEKSGQFLYSVTPTGKARGNSFNALGSERFQAVLERTETLIREFGTRIYSGDIAVHPYKKGAATACDQCQMQSVCRFDSWTQPYRSLEKPK